MSDVDDGRADPASHEQATYSGRTRSDGGTDSNRASRSQTRERLRQFANEQKNSGAQQMTGFANAAHTAADSLQADNPGVAGLVHEAADGLERVASDLRGRDVSSIYESMQDFARRQPVAFLVGSVAAGAVLARFLKSSAKGDQREPYPYHPSPKL